MSHAPDTHGHDTHSNHGDSHGGIWSFFSRKNVLWLWALWLWAAAYPPAIGTVIHGTAWLVQGALDLGVEGLTQVANTSGASFIGTLAPLAAPAIAGYYIANKITNWVGIKNKYARVGLNLAGGLLGASLAGSAAMPYLVGGTLAYAVGKTPLKWALNKVGATAGAVYDGAVAIPVSAAKAALSIPKWVWNATKSGFWNPTLWPNTGSSAAAAAH